MIIFSIIIILLLLINRMNPFNGKNMNGKNVSVTPVNNKRNMPAEVSSFFNPSSSVKNSAKQNGMFDALPSLPTTSSINKTLNSSLGELYTPVKNSVNEAMENNSSMLSIPVIIGLGILTVAFILITIFRDQVAYGLEVTWTAIKNAFASKPAAAVTSEPSQKLNIDHGAIQNIMPTKEVFNIADNKYKYSDADALCKAYGAELATYEQVKDAWSKGADWCNYGWVKGQAALFPTQESTYNKLQTGPKDQKGACGVPGVNGGYFDNPDLHFGVNCYGNKPSKSDASDRAQMKPHNLTNDALDYNKKVRDYKTEIHEIPISPFNATSWA
jgi:hypothetical protein